MAQYPNKMENEDYLITQQQTGEVARLLKSRKTEKQAEGKRLIEGMGLQGIDALFAIVREEQRKLKSRQRLYWQLILLNTFVSLGIIPLLNKFEKIFFTALILSYHAINATFNLIRFRSNLHNRILELLEETDDLRMVGVLIDNLDTVKSWRKLLELLSRLQASDAVLLNLEQRKKLYKHLERGYGEQGSNSENYEYVLAILKALEQIGDAEAIPHVEQLIQRTSNTLIRIAAEECLPFLQDRGHQRQIAETLLRPSQPYTPPDMLLRPANTTADTEPQQLLRASSESDACEKPVCS